MRAFVLEIYPKRVVLKNLDAIFMSSLQCFSISAVLSVNEISENV